MLAAGGGHDEAAAGQEIARKHMGTRGTATDHRQGRSPECTGKRIRQATHDGSSTLPAHRTVAVADAITRSATPSTMRWSAFTVVSDPETRCSLITRRPPT